MDNCCNGKKQQDVCCSEKNKNLKQEYYDLGFEAGRKTIKSEIKKIMESGMASEAIVNWLKGLIS